MRGAIWTGADTLTVETVSPCDPGPRDVVVRIEASGVCHSDLNVINGHTASNPPMLLGHEGAGIVDWVGSEVSRVKVGARVILSLTPVCGSCWHCLRQETHLCELGFQLHGLARVVRADGSSANALLGLGTFSDTATVHEASCVPVHTDLPPEQLALIGCGVTTGLGAALNTAKLAPGATTAVIGCGGVGISVIQGARLAGAATIIAVDPVAMKRGAAVHFGATNAVDPSTGDAREQVMALTGGRGVDVAFEVVGAAELIDQALAMTRRGGTTVLVGLPAHQVQLTTSAMGLVIQDKTIRGSFYGDARATRDFPRFLQLAERGRLDLASMVSTRLELDDINDAFDAMRAGTAVRSVVVNR
jgi:S-(hydroxymethyl)glutathione dehydrogenase / alcohol dehydrogenase